MAGRVILDAAGDPAFPQNLERALLDDLRRGSAQGTDSRIALAVRDEAGALTAGLDATTSYGWLRVGLLWVAPASRRAGLGRALLDRAVALARMRGCHSAWLETFNRTALAFDRSAGFAPFGALRNAAGQAPEGHMRWFLSRSFDEEVT